LRYSGFMQRDSKLLLICLGALALGPLLRPAR
jgi:hypothetical protein